MTPINKQKNDTKLLLAVAGMVVAGAAGIALLASLNLDGDTERKSPVARRAQTAAPIAATRSTPAPEIMTASYDVPAPVDPIAPAESGEPIFEIDREANFVARAIEAYDARDFDVAVAYLDAEVEARPHNAWTRYMHGLSLWKAGRPDEAVNAMEESATLDPDGVKTLVNLSRIHNDRADYEAALAAAQRALAIDAESPSALFLEGRSLMNLDRPDEAAASLVASVARDSENGYVHNMLGLCRLAQQEPREAIVAFERASELRPDVAFIHNNLGMSLELDGQRVEAVAAYRRAVEIDAGHDRAAINLARLEPTLPEGYDVIDAEPTEAVAEVEDTLEESEPKTDADTVSVASADVPEPAVDESLVP